MPLYVRVRPWRDRPFDIQAGRIPPVFGVAGRHIYASDNVLIGMPLAWQYLTVLRADAVPANADELIYARSYGWQPGYSVGDDGYARGVPLATAFRYDTGVEARIGDDASLGLGGGRAARPARCRAPGAALIERRPAGVDAHGVRPSPAWIVGASYADGRFVADTVRDGTATHSQSRPERYPQRTIGADAEYSVGTRAGPRRAGGRAMDAAGARSPVHRQSAVGDGRLGRGTLQDRAWRDGGRFAAITSAFNKQRGTDVTLPWDAPGDPCRGRRRVGGDATRHRSGLGAAQHADAWARYARRRSRPRR